jgi:N-hydroxyarylamine O-acetyltransferase
MLSTSELTAYLTDLGLTTTPEKNLNFVSELQSKHIAKYSFNNLAVVSGNGVSLETKTLIEKIVANGLGGYCFEHNKINFEALETLGFDVRVIMARVVGNAQQAVARTHRFTLLILQDEVYLVDVGFGGNSPITPLLLKPDIVQTSGLDCYRIQINADQEFELQIKKQDTFTPLYVFDLAIYTDADCEAANFYTANYPESKFVNNIVFTIKTAQKAVAVRNHEFIIRDHNGYTNQPIPSAKELAHIVEQNFGIVLEATLADHIFQNFLNNQA